MDALNILNLMQQMQYEQAVLNNKYEKLLSFMAEILNNIKNEQKIKMNDNRPRCKYHNKGYCKQGLGCSFSHANDICEEYLYSGSCNRGRDCPQRHPRQCRHWYKGRCWRANNCAYLHKKEDYNKHVENESVEVIDNATPEHLDEDICDSDISNDPNVKYPANDLVDSSKNNDIQDADDLNDNDIENNECKECTNEDKCVPCIMISAYEDLNSSFDSYEVEEESIEAIMAKAKTFEL